MIRKLILLSLAMLFPFLIHAQSGFTSVTGQVKDANSVPYANCSVTANFVDATGVTTRAATINGSPIPSRTIQSACDANGNFTIVVEDSAVVVPLGTTWQFTFSYTQHVTGLPNPAGQPQAPSFTYTAPICPNATCITGATISITSAISSLIPVINSTFGNGALKPQLSDAIQYVSANGNDTNDGLSVGTAKLTVAAACAALPSGNSSCAAGSGQIFVSPLFVGTMPSSVTAGVIISKAGNFSGQIATKSSPYTLTSSDSWISVTGTTTITVPHALTGQRWHVQDAGVNLVTIAPDSGTINGAGSIFIQPSVGVELTCDGTNCQATVSSTNGFPAQVTEVNLTAQNNNIGATTFYTVPAGGVGHYRASCYLVETTNAGTSSTLPQCNIIYTDADSSVVITNQATGNNANNTVGSIGNTSGITGLVILEAKVSSNIQYSTTTYASNPANAMQYAVHLRLEYMGP